MSNLLVTPALHSVIYLDIRSLLPCNPFVLHMVEMENQLEPHLCRWLAFPQFAPCTQRMNECCSELITSRTFNSIEQKKTRSCKTIAGEHKTNPNNNNRAFWRLAEVKWSAMYIDWIIWRNSQWKHFSFEMSNHVTLDFRANIQNSWMCWKVLDHWCNEFHFGPPWTFAFTFCLKSLLNAFDKNQLKDLFLEQNWTLFSNDVLNVK